MSNRGQCEMTCGVPSWYPGGYFVYGNPGGNDPSDGGGAMDIPLYGDACSGAGSSGGQGGSANAGFLGWLWGLLDQAAAIYRGGAASGGCQCAACRNPGSAPVIGTPTGGNGDFLGWLYGVTDQAAWYYNTAPRGPSAPPGPGAGATQINVPWFEHTMSIYSPDQSYSAEELRAAALANENNPAVKMMLMRMADMAEQYGREITAEDVRRMASSDGSFNERDILNLPAINGWGAIPDGAGTSHSYLRFIEDLQAVDNGDGVYTPDEIRQAAERQENESARNTLLYLAEVAEAYGIPVNDNLLQSMANDGPGSPLALSRQEVTAMPRKLGAQIVPRDEQQRYVDYIILIQMLSGFDNEQNGFYEVDELRQLLEAIRNDEIPCPNKGVYIQVLERMIAYIEEKGHVGIQDFNLANLAQSAGNDRWIGPSDINDNHMPQPRG